MLLALPCLANSPKMFFAEYRFVHPDIKEESFEATSRKVWRIGFKYLRIQEAPDPDQNIHGLIISNAPDTYIINLFVKSGKHVVDRGESIDVHVPVFQQPNLLQKIKELEMGHENAFFLQHAAQSIGTKIIDDIDCDVLMIKSNEYELTLYRRKDNGNPLQIGIRNGNIIYDLKYLTYEPDLEPDFTLFEVPSDIRIIEAN